MYGCGERRHMIYFSLSWQLYTINHLFLVRLAGKADIADGYKEHDTDKAIHWRTLHQFKRVCERSKKRLRSHENGMCARALTWPP